LDDVASVRLRHGLAADEEVVELLIDKFVEALDVGLVDVQAGRDAEKALELDDT
jgi:hypothetical protein